MFRTVSPLRPQMSPVGLAETELGLNIACLSFIIQYYCFWFNISVLLTDLLCNIGKAETRATVAVVHVKSVDFKANWPLRSMNSTLFCLHVFWFSVFLQQHLSSLAEMFYSLNHQMVQSIHMHATSSHWCRSLSPHRFYRWTFPDLLLVSVIKDVSGLCHYYWVSLLMRTGWNSGVKPATGWVTEEEWHISNHYLPC